jgi:ssDNA-binding Zn-finger/Zn-ribbon topoisomerase 1
MEETKCPECDGPMQSRKNKATGQVFWGCAAFPKCKGTRNTDGDAPKQRWDSSDGDRDQGSPSERARHNDTQRWRS